MKKKRYSFKINQLVDCCADTRLVSLRGKVVGRFRYDSDEPCYVVEFTQPFTSPVHGINYPDNTVKRAVYREGVLTVAHD